MAKKDPYKTLGVKKTASKEEIKKIKKSFTEAIEDDEPHKKGVSKDV